MSSSITITLDDYKSQINANILKLARKEPMNISDLLSDLKSPLLIGMLQQYSALSCESTSLLQAIITAIGAISGEIIIQNPIKVEELPLNLFTHLIGEPGTQKSSIIRIIRQALSNIDQLFPGVYSKEFGDRKISVFIQSETELSLSEKMSQIGDLFAVCDEIDAFLTRQGVFSSTEQAGALGSKMMCQSFDLIKDETRGTGSNTHTINSGKLSILGTSTGERYSQNMMKFNSQTGNDGVIARMSFHIIPCVAININPLESIWTSVPNLTHIFILIHLLAKEKVELRFEQSHLDLHNQVAQNVPLWMQELRSRCNINKPLLQRVNNNDLLIHDNTANAINDANNGNHTSALDVIKSYIELDLNESQVSEGMQPYIRAFLRKSGIKLPRYSGCYQLLFQASMWCEELIEEIDFMKGSHISNVNVDSQFIDAARELIRSKVAQLPQSPNNRPIMTIDTNIVKAAQKHYLFTKETSIELFSTDGIEEVVGERLVKIAKIKESVKQAKSSKKKTMYNEKYVMIAMASPFIMSSWLTNRVGSIQWSGHWNKDVPHARMILDKLERSGLLVGGSFIHYARDKSYMKVLPSSVRNDPSKLMEFETLEISMEDYEHAYKAMMIPRTNKLSPAGIEVITTSPEFVPYLHLYPQMEVLTFVKDMLKNNKIEAVFTENCTRYLPVLGSRLSQADQITTDGFPSSNAIAGLDHFPSSFYYPSDPSDNFSGTHDQNNVTTDPRNSPPELIEHDGSIYFTVPPSTTTQPSSTESVPSEMAQTTSDAQSTLVPIEVNRDDDTNESEITMNSSNNDGQSSNVKRSCDFHEQSSSKR